MAITPVVRRAFLSAIAVGLGGIPRSLPTVSNVRFAKTDRRKGSRLVRVSLIATDGITWECEQLADKRRGRYDTGSLRQMMERIVRSDSTDEPAVLPIVVFYDTDRSIVDRVKHKGATRANAAAARRRNSPGKTIHTSKKILIRSATSRWRGRSRLRRTFGSFFSGFVRRRIRS